MKTLKNLRQTISIVTIAMVVCAVMSFIASFVKIKETGEIIMVMYDFSKGQIPSDSLGALFLFLVCVVIAILSKLAGFIVDCIISVKEQKETDRLLGNIKLY